jgi:hypothetical protein
LSAANVISVAKNVALAKNILLEIVGKCDQRPSYYISLLFAVRRRSGASEKFL